MAMTNADLIVAIGARFDDRVTGKLATFAPHAKIIHIDVDPTSIKKNVRVDLPIVGDVKDVLTKMIKQADKLKDKVAEFKTAIAPWQADIAGWKEKHPIGYKNSTTVIKPQFVIQKLRELSDDDAIISTDVGQHQMWTAQFFPVQQAAHPADVRRTRHHGLRPAGCHGRPGSLSRATGDHHLRRRRCPDEYPGNGDPGAEQAAGEDRHPQQQLPRHGTPMAGAVL